MGSYKWSYKWASKQQSPCASKMEPGSWSGTLYYTYSEELTKMVLVSIEAPTLTQKRGQLNPKP